MPKAHDLRPYKKRWALPSHIHVTGASIYAIINSENLKVYIGSAIRTNNRWCVHRSELEDGNHANPYFQRAFNANPTVFQLEVVEWIPNPTKAILLDREQFWMDFFKSYKSDKGYNSSPKSSSCLGVKHPPEYGARISRNTKGIKWSEERKRDYRIKRSKLPKQKGRVWTEGERLKQSLRLMGLQPSAECRRKRSEKMTGKRFPQMGRKIIQISKDGTEVRTWEAIAYAAKELNIKECNIRQCLSHPNWTSGGFKWRDA